MHHDIQLFAEYAVTPFVGVWIETVNNSLTSVTPRSHPSWVCGLKQKELQNGSKTTLSHPSWVCGLKQELARPRHTEPRVTPFVGVWIETRNRQLKAYKLWSHPSWVCGLKHEAASNQGKRAESHPSWVCGLKPV